MEIPHLPHASRVTLKCVFYSGSFPITPRSNLIEKASCVDFLLHSTSPASFPCDPRQCFLEFSARYGIAFQDVSQSPSKETQIKTFIFPNHFSFPSTDFFSHCSSKLPKSLFRNFAPSVSSCPQKNEGAGAKERPFVCPFSARASVPCFPG